jgi:uncharacterized RmlC-like cupin family protein
MGESNHIRRTRPDERVVGDPTPGMVREQAITAEGLWSGLVTTEAGMESGWHHHGEHETSIYVVDGALRMQWGPDGTSTLTAVAGDFVRVPKRVVHREGNPGEAPSHLVVTRAGSGPVTVNVDGPQPRSG